ncbi:MAG TPA: glycosyl hydrolase family 28 protein [Clostridia bacterium]|nr:glycosyl hydrolase family 28 protein [Clostridia bacterium]
MFGFLNKLISWVLALSLSMVGVWLDDFHEWVLGDDIFPVVYEGDFYEGIEYEKYIDFEAVVLPDTTVFDIRDYGADVSNNAQENKDAINAAVNACYSSGDGTVLVDGGSYITGSIRLKSNVTLKIADGSSLVASRNAQDMDLNCVIYANGCENIKITGPGRVCGEGNYYSKKPMKKPLLEPLEYTNAIEMRHEYLNRLRKPHESKYGRISNIYNCSNVTIGNIIFENSAHWTLRIDNSEDVLINKFIINNNRHIANTDGIDILYSRDVEIKNSFISTADDGIVIKNWQAGSVVKNIHISNCEIMSCTNAFKIGTETRGDISDVLVEDCKFFMKDIYPGSFSGIAIESMDGSIVKNITVRNIEMDRITCPLFIRLGNRNRYADETSDFSGSIEGVTIQNITATRMEIPIIITGVKNLSKGTNHVKDITLRNLDLEYTTESKEPLTFQIFVPEYEKEYPDSWRFFNLPAYGIWSRHTDGLTIDNFNVTPREKTIRSKFVFNDVKNLEF